LLAERIRIREDELRRLSDDVQTNRKEFDERNTELAELKSKLEAAHAFGRAITVYDPQTREERAVPATELTLVTLGSIWLDSAKILIGDPWHLRCPRDLELEEHAVPKDSIWFKENATGALDFTNSLTTQVWSSRLEGLYTIQQMVDMKMFSLVDPPRTLPADPDTYIQGQGITTTDQNGIKRCTFLNGLDGAGIVVSTRGDGEYAVRAETHNGSIRRLMVDLY
jgi:hypothetical protein